MKILVITRNAWDDTNAIGNTISNFFQDVNNIEFASIYFRSSAPNNKLCDNYFRSSEVEIIKKWFRPDEIGEHFHLSLPNEDKHAERKNCEKQAVRWIQRCGISLAYKISDYLWYSEKWSNEKLDRFIESFSPDMMVTFVKSAPQYYLTVKHLREKFNIPLFSWIADDEYTGLLHKNRQKEIENLKYILKESAVVRGCTKELCDYYNSIFECEAEPLYKSCARFAPLIEKKASSITMVYAGNLLYGRLDIICAIADELKNIMLENNIEVHLDVYSNTTLLAHEEKKYFKTRPHIRYLGKKGYDYVQERLAGADIVLHVESFERNQILKTKYSFSTKIIDYLQSGSVVLAVGPEELASMKYIRSIPGTYVINSMDRLSEEMMSILNNTSDYLLRAARIREFAQQNHSTAAAAREMARIIERTMGRRQ